MPDAVSALLANTPTLDPSVLGSGNVSAASGVYIDPTSGEHYTLANVAPGNSNVSNAGGTSSKSQVVSKIAAEAAKQGVDPHFALNVGHTESGFDPDALSPKGAIGPMQLMPKTAQSLGVDPHDTDDNIKGGVTYLKQLLDQFGGDQKLAAAAYNAGPNAVLKHGGVPPNTETQAYVQKVTGYSQPSEPPDEAFSGQAGAPAPAEPPDEMFAQKAAAATPMQSPGYQNALSAYRTSQAKSAAIKAAIPTAYTPPPQADITGQFINSLALNSLPTIAGGLNAIGTTLSNLFGNKTNYTPGEAYAAGRDIQQQQLNQTQQQHPLASMGAQAAGFMASPLTKALAVAAPAKIAAALPQAAQAARATPYALSALGAGLAGGAAGAGQGVAEGGSASDVAKSAALGAVTAAPFGPLGEGASALGGAFKSQAAKTLAPVAGHAALGALGGGLAGYGINPKYTEKGAIAGAVLGLSGKVAGLREAAKGPSTPTEADYLTALHEIANTVGNGNYDAAIQHLENAPEKAHTAAEALSPEHRQDLLQKSAGQNASNLEPSKTAIAERQQADAVKTRLKTDLEKITGGNFSSDESTITENLKNSIEKSGLPHPDLAQLDYDDFLERHKQEQSNPLWQAIDKSAPLYNDDYKELLKNPLVRRALGRATSTIGVGSETENPDFVANPKTHAGDHISAAELKELLGRPVTPEDFEKHFSAEREQNQEPEIVPTVNAWLKTQKYLNGNIVRHPFNGSVLPENSQFGHLPDNYDYNRFSTHLNNLNKENVPGLTEAKASSGDEASGRKNSIIGSNLGNKSGPTWQEHRRIFGELDEGDREAQRFGYSKQMSQDFGKIDPETGAGLDTFIKKYSTENHKEIQRTLLGSAKANELQKSLYNIKLAKLIDAVKIKDGNIEPADLKAFEHILTSEPEHNLQNKIYGETRATEIRAVIRRELDLAKSGKEVSEFQPKNKEEKLPIEPKTSAVFGALGSLKSIPHMVEGAGIGYMGGKVAQALPFIADTVTHGDFTPGARKALGEHLAKSPAELAEDLKAAKAKKSNMKLSESTVAKKLVKQGTLGLGLTAGHGINALTGVNGNR